MMLLGVMLLGVGLVLGLHRRFGLGRSSSLLGGRGGSGRGGLGGERRDRKRSRDEGGEDQLTHCNGLLEMHGSRWPGARIFRLIGSLDAERRAENFVSPSCNSTRGRIERRGPVRHPDRLCI